MASGAVGNRGRLTLQGLVAKHSFFRMVWQTLSLNWVNQAKQRARLVVPARHRLSCIFAGTFLRDAWGCSSGATRTCWEWLCSCVLSRPLRRAIIIEHIGNLIPLACCRPYSRPTSPAPNAAQNASSVASYDHGRQLDVKRGRVGHTTNFQRIRLQ